MRKKLAVLLAGLMVFSTLAGCGQKDTQWTPANSEAVSGTETVGDTENGGDVRYYDYTCAFGVSVLPEIFCQRYYNGGSKRMKKWIEAYTQMFAEQNDNLRNDFNRIAMATFEKYYVYHCRETLLFAPVLFVLYGLNLVWMLGFRLFLLFS